MKLAAGNMHIFKMRQEAQSGERITYQLSRFHEHSTHVQARFARSFQSAGRTWRVEATWRAAHRKPVPRASEQTETCASRTEMDSVAESNKRKARKVRGTSPTSDILERQYMKSEQPKCRISPAIHQGEGRGGGRDLQGFQYPHSETKRACPPPRDRVPWRAGEHE